VSHEVCNRRAFERWCELFDVFTAVNISVVKRFSRTG